MKLLKFYANWCNPCKQQTKLLEGLSIEVQPIDIEMDDNESITGKYAIRSLPTMVIVDDEGTELKRFTGLTQKSVIEDYLTTLKK